jgi:hypothetical protein
MAVGTADVVNGDGHAWQSIMVNTGPETPSLSLSVNHRACFRTSQSAIKTILTGTDLKGSTMIDQTLENNSTSTENFYYPTDSVLFPMGNMFSEGCDLMDLFATIPLETANLFKGNPSAS